MEEKNFELEIAPLTDEELDAVDGGAGKYENEIARISRGTVFSVKTDKVSGNYIWASYGGQTGWVDKRFIQYC